MRFTKAFRQEVVDAYVAKHGRFDVQGFLAEASDPGHPAHGWFTWDDEAAAHRYRLDQAREFISGLRITFEVKKQHRSGVRVVTTRMPLAIAGPDGSGYTMTDPGSKEGRRPACREAARTLRQWVERYQGAVLLAGGSLRSLERVADALENY